MAISEYCDFVIEAEADQRNETGTLRFRMHVSSSPAGQSAPEWRSVPKQLNRDLYALRHRRMELSGIINVGERLSNLLLSDWERRLFSDSLRGLALHQGLRVRLHLPPGLAHMPWEYMYMKREGSRKDITGFLALDSQVSIMRHEVSASARQSDIVLQTCRFLVVTAEPGHSSSRFPPLDLSRERAEIADALCGVPGIELDFLKNPSVQRLGDNLLGGVDVFHFSGHGDFEARMGERFGTFEGEGQITLFAYDGEPEFVPEGRLAVALRGNGTQLAVLTSSESGRQTDMSSGLAAALVKVRIPAVVAMQHSIRDSSAIAFCRSLYRALAVGLPLDRAVAEGRRAIYRCNSEDDRDWGVPVLYLQAQNLVLQTSADVPKGSDEVDRSDVPEGSDEVDQSALWRAMERRLDSTSLDVPEGSDEVDWSALRRAMERRLDSTSLDVPEGSDEVDRSALRKAMVRRLDSTSLATLCQDVEVDLEKAKIDLQVNPQMVGGSNMPGTVLKLIQYLERHGSLSYLVDRLQKSYSWVMDEYEKLA